MLTGSQVRRKFLDFFIQKGHREVHSSSLVLLPVTIFMYRAQQGAHDPTLVFLPILLATCASAVTGLLTVASAACAAACATARRGS